MENLYWSFQWFHQFQTGINETHKIVLISRKLLLTYAIQINLGMGSNCTWYLNNFNKSLFAQIILVFRILWCIYHQIRFCREINSNQLIKSTVEHESSFFNLKFERGETTIVSYTDIIICLPPSITSTTWKPYHDKYTSKIKYKMIPIYVICVMC